VKIFASPADPDSPEPLSEVQIHSDLAHPHIVQYLGRFELGDLRGIVMELVDGPRLLDHVVDHGRLTEADACGIFAQIVGAVAYLHRTKSVVHRDIKLENILLTRGGAAKLIDFGFACRGSASADEKWCSEPYAAPEIASGVPYDRAVDIWSLGVVLQAMVCGEFRDLNCGSEIPQTLSAPLRDLLGKMFNRDPKARIDIAGILGHPWLAFAPSLPTVTSVQRVIEGWRPKVRHRRVSC
jgi:protein-serine/threonine kinase